MHYLKRSDFLKAVFESSKNCKHSEMFLCHIARYDTPGIKSKNEQMMKDILTSFDISISGVGFWTEEELMNWNVPVQELQNVRRIIWLILAIKHFESLGD